MKFKLQNGQIMAAKKDCNCVTHNGPHWIHMDDLDKELNKPLLKSNPLGFAINEKARLDRKLREMNSRQIVEILR